MPDPLLRSLLSYPSSNKWLDIRNLCMFELMAFSGLRIGEVIRLRLTDICLSTRQIKVFGKGSIERFVPISEKSAKHMAHYISLTDSYRINNNLFITQTGKPIHHSTVRYALRQQAQNVGITQHITPHSLRHSCATHFAKQTKDLRFVQLLLGHRNISTTQIYVHLDHEYMAKTFDEHCIEN